MQITVIDVGTPNTHAGAGGRSYQSMEVTYKGVDGKVASKKLMSFSNPSIFNTAKTWSKGQEVNVITQKDDKGYWQWTGLDVTGESSVAESKPTAAGGAGTNTRTVGSNYETKEERAQRQVYIVRQSSISAAVAALTAGAKAPPSQEDILNLARTFEAHVFAVPSAIDSLVDFDSDIPE
jgi:hypothetical protein